MKPPKPCQCGRPKPSHTIACATCWHSLPLEVRTDIACQPAVCQQEALRAALLLITPSRPAPVSV